MEGANAQAHIAKIMHGTCVTYESIVDHSRTAFVDMLPQLDLVTRHASALVGAMDLALQLRCATPGQAAGPSLVPPELLRAAPREVAALLEPLAL